MTNDAQAQAKPTVQDLIREHIKTARSLLRPYEVTGRDKDLAWAVDIAQAHALVAIAMCLAEHPAQPKQIILPPKASPAPNSRQPAPRRQYGR